MTMAMTPNTAWGGIVDEGAHHLAALTQRHQRETEQDREQQNLQDVALGKSTNHAVRNDVEDEINRFQFSRLLQKPGHLGRICTGAGKALAGLHDIADKQADGESEGGDDLEVNEGLHTDATNRAGVLNMGNAGHHGAENDRRDHHLDQFDEAIAHRLDPVIGGEDRKQPADNGTKHNGEKHLYIKLLINRLFRLFDHRSSACGDCGLGHWFIPSKRRVAARRLVHPHC
jgi:hypothetical protein